MFTKQLIISAKLLFAMTLLTGVIYPLVVFGIGQIVFPDQANGSLIIRDGQTVGSSLIGQTNRDPHYFWGRPSAVNTSPASGGSNLAWTNPLLAQQVAERAAEFRTGNGLGEEVIVPGDMLFASASGLDPHISPTAARLQIDRVAEVRQLPREKVATLVEDHIESPQLGFLGEARVNVLELNLALDKLE